MKQVYKEPEVRVLTLATETLLMQSGVTTEPFDLLPDLGEWDYLFF